MYYNFIMNNGLYVYITILLRIIYSPDDIKYDTL